MYSRPNASSIGSKVKIRVRTRDPVRQSSGRQVWLVFPLSIYFPVYS